MYRASKGEGWSNSPFARLKEALGEGKIEPAAHRPPPVPPENEVRAEDEEALFLKAMADVKEIPEFRSLPAGTPPPTARSLNSIRRQRYRSHASASEHLRGIIEGREPIVLSDTSEYVEWLSPKLTPAERKRIHTKLGSGALSVKEFLDLHGLTRAEAEEELREFLRSAVRNGTRAVKIIHGRGLRSPKGPVLKEAVCYWLSGPMSKWVRAFITARSCDGGLGALYVIINTKANPCP